MYVSSIHATDALLAVQANTVIHPGHLGDTKVSPRPASQGIGAAELVSVFSQCMVGPSGRFVRESGRIGDLDPIWRS
jgi:hypothetical protein